MRNLDPVLMTLGFLDQFDLVPIQIVLSISGALLSMWYIQLPSTIVVGESRALFCARRIGVGLVAIGLLWSVSYAYYRGWQPWAPYLIVLLGINLALASAILTATAVKKNIDKVPAILSE